MEKIDELVTKAIKRKFEEIMVQIRKDMANMCRAPGLSEENEVDEVQDE